ncbi:hypothetical protein LIER_24738 [Lithospermum erythrorhizon]|uniref:Uncharacterized protein n=1 Tax=Lithospermum erythrorhizon TaxID=34254 RepID=A0AAV3R6H5_LITER
MYSGEGEARFYEGTDAYIRIRMRNLHWSRNKLEQATPYRFVDEAGSKNSYSDTCHFLSIRSSMLPVRRGSTFGLEPYNPHRFPRQFGYCQDIPYLLSQIPLVKETYTKDSEIESPRLSHREGNEVVDEAHEVVTGQPPRQFPTHGKGKQLHLFRDGVLPTLFKWKQPSGDDEVDSREDRNFKHLRVTEGTSPLNLSSGGNSFLHPNIEILEEVGEFCSIDLELLGSFIGDTGDAGREEGIEHSSTLMLIEDPARTMLPQNSSIPANPAPVLVEPKPLSKLDRDCVEAIWQKLSPKLDGKPLRDILSMEAAVDRISYGEKLKRIEEVSKKVRQTKVREADLRRELEGLEKQKQELRVLLQQDEEALRLSQSDISTFEGHVSTLEETIRMSKTDEERLRQLDADLEIKK